MKRASVGETVAAAYEHLKQGQDERALQLLDKAVRQAPSVAVIRYLLGMAQVRQNRLAAGILNLEKAVDLDESNVDYLLSLGEALMTEQPLEAIKRLARAVELGSKSPEAYRKLALLLIEGGKPEDALRVCRQGASVCGPQPGILGSRALALKAGGRAHEALECLKALPNDVTTMINLAAVLFDLGRVPESRSYLERAHALEPANPLVRFNLGVTLLVEGRYVEGFREYEARLELRPLTPFEKPFWDGSDLKGRRILLHAEQGAGDTIQFVRYANFVRSRGGEVILSVPTSLSRLLRWLEDYEITTPGSEPTFDVHCPLLSLPRLAGTDKDNIPPPAHFEIPGQMKEKWNALLGEKRGKRIGLVWAGAPTNRNDRNRSIPFSLFRPLLAVPDVEWFGLQVGQACETVRDLAPELTDYAETAAAISQLDLVISVDTSVAHLAGSLGTPVWMLTPFAPDWRWLLDRSDSPWYPSMRLFRQPQPGDWASVIQALMPLVA